MSAHKAIKATRIYTGQDQKSHFADIEIPLDNKGQIGFLSQKQKASGVIFRETAGDYDYDWHNAPERQFVIVLEGVEKNSVSIDIGSSSLNKQIDILLKKFSLVVFKYSPDNSDLSENATA